MAERKHRPPPPPDHARPYEIVPGLYISGHPDSAHDFISRGIHAVVDLEGDIDSAIGEGGQPEGSTLYLYWPIEDGPMPDATTVRSVSMFVAALLDEDKKVLVHCRSGHNRSGMICACALIEQGNPPEDAIRIVREQRGDGHALENEAFVEWLMEGVPPARRQ
ncbi:MAG: protein-tyrosine phosphatase family protein [Actinomycetota bacterium]